MSLRDFGFSSTGFVPSNAQTIICDDKIYCLTCAEEMDLEGEESEYPASQCVQCGGTEEEESEDLAVDLSLDDESEDLDKVAKKVGIKLAEEEEEDQEEEIKEEKRIKRQSKMLDNVIESLHGKKEEKPKKQTKPPQKEIKQCQAVPLVARVKINGVWTEQPVRI